MNCPQYHGLHATGLFSAVPKERYSNAQTFSANYGSWVSSAVRYMGMRVMHDSCFFACVLLYWVGNGS